MHKLMQKEGAKNNQREGNCFLGATAGIILKYTLFILSTKLC